LTLCLDDDPDKLFLTSAIVELQDELVAREFIVDPNASLHPEPVNPPNLELLSDGGATPLEVDSLPWVNQEA
jgi:hypothetical protein